MRPTSRTPRIWGRPRPGLPDQVGGWDAMVGVGHLDGLDAPVPELADVLADRDPLERWPRLLLDDEGGDALRRAGGQGHEAGALAVGHPRLGAVDHVLVPIPLGLAGDVAGVAAGIRLGQGQRTSPLARWPRTGSHRCFCSSLPWCRSRVATMVWVLTTPVRLIHP